MALETFLETILWKPFQLLRRILSDVSRITTAPTLQCRFQLRAGENQLKPGQKIIVDAPVLSHCSLLRNLWQKPTGVLEHYREGETSCLFSIFRDFASYRIPTSTKDVNVQLFIHSSNSWKFYQWIPGHFVGTATSFSPGLRDKFGQSDPMSTSRFAGHDITPRSTSCRLVYITTYFTALVLLAAYSAALISSLTVYRSNLPFQDLEGILRDRTYKLGVVDKSEMYYTVSVSW